MADGARQTPRPAAIVNKLGAEFAKAARAPDVAPKPVDDGTLMIGSTPEQFRQYIAAESSRWRKVVQDSGIRLEL